MSFAQVWSFVGSVCAPLIDMEPHPVIDHEPLGGESIELLFFGGEKRPR